jgi:hypothetical protein
MLALWYAVVGLRNVLVSFGEGSTNRRSKCCSNAHLQEREAQILATIAQEYEIATDDI